MSIDSRSKLNRLLAAWSLGTVAVSRWLQSKGAYQQLVHGHEKSRSIKVKAFVHGSCGNLQPFLAQEAGFVESGPWKRQAHGHKRWSDGQQIRHERKPLLV